MSLLFPILNIAATCEFKVKVEHRMMEPTGTITMQKSNPVAHPFILTPRWLCSSHLKNGAAKAPNVHGKAVAIAIHDNLEIFITKN